MGITEIADAAAFATAIATKDKLVVIDFFATWCGPCLRIAPFMETLEKQYQQNTLFIKVDVDKTPDIAEEQGVTAMPTFMFYLNGKLVDQLLGANNSALEEKIKKYTAQLK